MTERNPRKNRDREPLARAAALAALAGAAPAPDSDCPPPVDILAWQERRLTGTAAARIESHVARCERCFAIWTGLLELGESPAADAPERGSPRPTWLTRAALVLTAAAAATVSAIFVLPSLLPPEDFAPLPAYELRLAGSATLRGTEPADEPRLLRNGDRFELVLVPATAVDGPLIARVYRRIGEQLTELDAPPAETLDNGVLRITGIVGSNVDLGTGEITLLIAAGRPDALPDGAALARALDPRGAVATENWVGWRVPLLVDQR